MSFFLMMQCIKMYQIYSIITFKPYVFKDLEINIFYLCLYFQIVLISQAGIVQNNDNGTADFQKRLKNEFMNAGV